VTARATGPARREGAEPAIKGPIMSFTILPRSWAPYAQALLRIVIGLAFLQHGLAKLIDFPHMDSLNAMPMGMKLFAGTIETVCGALMIAGFFTRPVAFLACGFMAFAYFLFHWPAFFLGGHGSFFPALNYGEAALLYTFSFLFFAAAGPGAWAVDKD
jgi:putative oxidoreductase